MIDILSGDHLQLALLCDRLAPDGSARSLPPALRRPPVVDVLIATLTRHLCAEEQYLYPTVRAVLASMMARYDLTATFPGDPHLEIDVTDVAPTATAERIVAQYGLPRRAVGG